jgi:hypothetical protein
MSRLAVLAFAAAMALWGFASIPAGDAGVSATIDGVRSATAQGQADGSPRRSAFVLDATLF